MSTGPESRDWFARALRVQPGGVDSPVRAFGAVGGEPLVIASARGATITDVDGRDYLDFVGSWGPLILGHAHPAVVKAIQAAVRKGTTYAAFVLGVLAVTFVYPLCVDKAVEIGNRILREPGFKPEKEYIIEPNMVTSENAAALVGR